jgi:alcohol dehydrogenase (NADP+)
LKECNCHGRHAENHEGESAPDRRTVLETGFAAGVFAALGADAAAAPAGVKTLPAAGYAAPSATGALKPFRFKRRAVGPKDVLIDILYCGICHSDIHTVRGEWPGTVYPCVPGHEILGRVVRVGKEVTKFRPGDIAAVGCMVDSCGHCENCKDGLEQYCTHPATFTYNSQDPGMNAPTYGGYSTLVVVTEKFVVKIPPGMDLAGSAPLLCAGITTYSPLRHWHAGPGKRVGIVGIGGLGHVGVKISSALGAETYAITTSPDKAVDAKRLGAAGAILSTDKAAMTAAGRKFDLLVDTIPYNHELHPLFSILKRDGVLVIVGALTPKMNEVNHGEMVGQRLSLAGSCIGGMAETQEVGDFCAAHKIVADATVIPIQKVNEAMNRVVAKDVRYRFVIDLASLKKEKA